MDVNGGTEVAEVLNEIKVLEAQGFSFEAAEASVALMLKRQQPAYKPPFELIDFSVERRTPPGARHFCRGHRQGARATAKSMHTAAEGNGPVNALDAALRKALIPHYPRHRQFHLADYKVRILDSDNGTGATTRVLIDTQNGTKRWSTVGASANIIEASWRALADAVEYGLTIAVLRDHASGDSMKANIVLLPGDGIGPEVVPQAVRVLDVIAQEFDHSFELAERLIGGCSIDRYGAALTDETLADCQASDAVLLGAVGGPKWDDPPPRCARSRVAGACARGWACLPICARCACIPAWSNASPLKPEKLAGVDMLVVRELTGGLYFGQPKGREMRNGHEHAVDTLEYYDYEVRRVVELAFELAKGRRKKVTSVDKANVLESSRLWRQIATAIGAEHQDIALDHMLVDTASMRLIANPASFDVLVTENMFGDILTDEASVLAGSMGLLPSASLGASGPGLYEPIHGSAPGHCRTGHRQPYRHDLERGVAFALLAQVRARSRRHRDGGGWRHRRRLPHRRPGRQAHDKTNGR